MDEVLEMNDGKVHNLWEVLAENSMRANIGRGYGVPIFVDYFMVSRLHARVIYNTDK